MNENPPRSLRTYSGGGGEGRELQTVDWLHISDSNATEESLAVLIRAETLASTS
jgi:hypothetical protein